jgi:DNA-directed RNA polymerase
MEWLTKAVRGITDQNKNPHWTVPVTGLVVEQRYFNQDTKYVTTAAAGGTRKRAPKKKRYHVYKVDTAKVATSRHGRSIPANFVHSLDAAVMMKTSLLASAEQSDIHLSMVHDSFSTIPSDCELLSRNCRQAVTLIFQNDVLGNLYRELASQWKRPEECPEPPRKGTLDVALILASAYAYA